MKKYHKCIIAVLLSFSIFIGEFLFPVSAKAASRYDTMLYEVAYRVMPTELLWPISASSMNVTSNCGWRNVSGGTAWHHGIDIGGVTTSTPVRASRSGTVRTGYQSGSGNYVIIDHGDGWYTEYQHLSSFAVSDGNYVNQGSTVGYCGNTGGNYAVHLHYEVVYCSAGSGHLSGYWSTYGVTQVASEDSTKLQWSDNSTWFVCNPLNQRFTGVSQIHLGDRDLSKGSTGTDVRELQQLLLNLKISVGSSGADGSFGNDTQTAVNTFRSRYGISGQTGVFDSACYNKLMEVLGFISTTAYLDVNGWLDGGFSGDLSDYGTVDVYINGNLVADDVNDYYVAWPVGTSYEIRDIRAHTGHIYWGPHISNLSGTIDASGTDVELSFDKDGILPTVSNVRVTNLSSEGYTVTCTVSDNIGVTKVQFPTWYEGQQGEDATWHDGTISGNTASCYIRVSDHDGKTGLNYHTDIYAWDAAGNVASTNARYNFVPNPTVRVTSITLDKSNLTMDIGTTYKLAATVLPSNATDKSLFWATNNSAACTVDDGVVTAVGAGTAIITCAANDGSSVSVTCTVTVNEPVPDFILPAGLIEIEEEAFAGINAQRIIIPDGVQRIGKRAFAGCTKLKYIYIPAATTQIASDAFSGVSSNFVIHGKYNSYARTYASQNGYTFVADDVCTITFDANGGSCSTTSKTINIGSVIGTLPSATRSYYTFNGWYTAASSGSKLSASSTITSSTTLYAHWTENEWSEWVTEDQLPSGTIQKESKQQYRYQDKIYSSWSDWGPRTETRESTGELKKEQQLTEHYWYYDLCQNCGRHSPYTVCWDCGHNIGANWRVTWLDTSRNEGGQFGDSDKIFTMTDEGRWFYWTDDNGNGDSRTVYQYATRTYSWSNWSGWSDAIVAASTTRNVDTRYVFRYKLP